MKLICDIKHPNGLKIYIASLLADTHLEINENKGIKFGAVLEVPGTPAVKLSANSAVLYLLNATTSSSGKALQWIEWEASTLQIALIPYLQNIANGKDDKSLKEALTATLKPLSIELNNSTTLFTEELGPVDVILFSSLVPLVYEEKSRTYLQMEHPTLLNYLNKLMDEKSFKKCLKLWYGNRGLTLKPWVSNLTVPYSQEASTSNLLKNYTSSPSPSPSTEKENEIQEEKQISSDDVDKAREGWLNIPKINSVSVTKPPKKILPIDGENNVLITSALPYVNNVPHLGNIIGSVLSADCFARFCRLRGDNVLYICGTDEYGTATETKALAESCTPKQICDKYNAIHSDIYQWFNISFDHFGRTTTAHQTEIAQSIFWNLEKNGNITRNAVDQLFCSNCERFLADRFVEGICPHPGCSYEDARGDQCDGCSKLINATDLIKPRCKLCSQAPRIKTSKHLFLNLPKIESELKTWIAKSSPQWTSNAKVICESWIRDGLKERCITRDLKWGTPVPLDGYTDKVFYVWFDAPIGYVSITKDYTEDWEKWWKNPNNVSYYEFMAKDNVPFHSVVFPSCQLGTNESWTMVTHLIASEYLNYEDGKFSKSRGIGVFGDQAKETGIDSDIWRFYLLFARPETHDTAFSWFDLQTKNNSELLNNVGNFINRSLKFVYQFYNGIVPDAEPNGDDYRIMAAINQEYESFISALASCKIRDALRHILAISKIGNQYIQENEPYKLIKPNRSNEEKARGATVISIGINIVALLAIIMEPYMPNISKTVCSFLNDVPELSVLPSKFTCLIKPGSSIKEPAPLIRKITDDEIENLKVRFAGRCTPSPSNDKSSQCKNNTTAAATNNTPTKPTSSDPIEAARVETLVTEQGNKVRELKQGGADKETIKIAVEMLLKLKQQLAAAQGIDPATLVTSNKDKKKKKK